MSFGNGNALMSISDLISRLFDFLNVRRCLVCREPIAKTQDLCPECFAVYKKELSAECGICGKRLCECSCSNALLSKHGVKRMVKLFRYRPAETDEHSLNLLLYRLKHHYIKDLHTFMAQHLAEALEACIGTPKPCVITFVPRTVREKRKYGFDQSAEMAKALSLRTGIPFAALLRRNRRASPQKKMRSAEERIKNAKDSYLTASAEDLRGKTVFLLDDAVTTGASIAACAHLLRKMGAKEIIAVAPFISFRHKNIHFEHMKNSREERFYLKSK